jgi:hypothetical protein
MFVYYRSGSGARERKGWGWLGVEWQSDLDLHGMSRKVPEGGQHELRLDHGSQLGRKGRWVTLETGVSSSSEEEAQRNALREDEEIGFSWYGVCVCVSVCLCV